MQEKSIGIIPTPTIETTERPVFDDVRNIGVYVAHAMRDLGVVGTPQALNSFQPSIFPPTLDEFAQRDELFGEIQCFGDFKDPHIFIPPRSDQVITPPQNPITLPMAYIFSSRRIDPKITALLFGLSTGHNNLLEISADGSVWLGKDSIVELNESFMKDAVIFMEVIHEVIELALSDPEQLVTLTLRPEEQSANIEQILQEKFNLTEREMRYINKGREDAHNFKQISHLVSNNADNLVGRSKRYSRNRTQLKGLRAFADTEIPRSINAVLFERSLQLAQEAKAANMRDQREIPSQDIGQINKPTFDPDADWNNSPTLSLRQRGPSSQEKKRERSTSETTLSSNDVRDIIVAIATGVLTQYGDDQIMSGLSESILATCEAHTLDEVTPILPSDVTEEMIMELVDTGFLEDFGYGFLAQVYEFVNK